MKTTLSPERLVEIHAEGRAQTGPFVNPHAIARGEIILRERGEEWAQSILLHRFDRRSLLRPTLPWLRVGEVEILVLADKAEWELLEAAIR